MTHRRAGRTASLLLCVSVPAFGLLPGVAGAQVGIGVSITVAPPEIPVYAQPEIPGPGYLWTPGYWAWGERAYYWVPGAWVLAPQPGYLWTPGYWAWANGAYLWHRGYWGAHVGYYGGVNYGYGYGGSGYQGGYWAQDHFFYNRSVNNLRGNSRITNVYNRTVSNENATRVSYNGGHGGTTAHASTDERAAASESHLNPVPEQVRQEQVARTAPRAPTPQPAPSRASGPRPEARQAQAPAQHPQDQHPQDQHPQDQHPQDQHPQAQRADQNRGDNSHDR